MIALTQKVLDGDLADPINFPGFRSAGIKVVVLPADRQQVSVSLKLTIDHALTDLITTSFIIEQLIISYINNLGIGDSVIVAEIIDRAMSVFGVINVTDVLLNEVPGDQNIPHTHAAFAGDIDIT